MSTVPAVCAGVVAVIVPVPATVTFVAVFPPSFTVAPARKFVPVMVTAVPPLAVPDVGEMALTVGAGLDDADATVKLTVVECCSEPELAAIEMEVGPFGVLATVATVRVVVAEPTIGFTQAGLNEQF